MPNRFKMWTLKNEFLTYRGPDLKFAKGIGQSILPRIRGNRDPGNRRAVLQSFHRSLDLEFCLGGLNLRKTSEATYEQYNGYVVNLVHCS